MAESYSRLWLCHIWLSIPPRTVLWAVPKVSHQGACRGGGSSMARGSLTRPGRGLSECTRRGRPGSKQGAGEKPTQLSWLLETRGSCSLLILGAPDWHAVAGVSPGPPHPCSRPTSSPWASPARAPQMRLATGWASPWSLWISHALSSRYSRAQSCSTQFIKPAL